MNNQTESHKLVMMPLGGVGEIGMNATLYGHGTPKHRKWMMVDLGLTFAGPDQPGIDLIMPDVSFIEKHSKNLLGLVITHAHEDHIGALVDLWPKLRCPVYATSFAASLLEVRRLSDPKSPNIPITIISPNHPLVLGPFSIEFIRMAHSIPEACGLAIETDVGTIVHTGDWRIDPTPVVGWQTDEARLTALGDKGVLALVSDSTNIIREGSSLSEADVALTLHELIKKAKHRVVLTTFASSVARLRSVAEAAHAAGREVILVGRAMERVVQVARETGHLDGLPEFLPASAYKTMDRDKIVVLVTGSQGEPRAAMSRIAREEHPLVRLSPGDQVIFSSHTIPGNERVVNNVINLLVDQNVDVITERTHLVHVSGHPRPEEVAKMYEWVRPKIAIPVHGEPLHLAAHANFARELGVPYVFNIRNGDTLSLGPDEPEVIDHHPVYPLLKDGEIFLHHNDEAVKDRVRLGFAGCVSLAIALTAKGDMAGSPDVLLEGIPERIGKELSDALVDRVLFETFESLAPHRRKDIDVLTSALERSIRGAFRATWGKKPQVHVLIVEV